MILASASPLSLVLTGATAAAYLVLASGAMCGRPPFRWCLVFAACGLHGALLALGLLGLQGHQPHFGFAPALSVTAWLVALVYAVESHFYPRLQTPPLVSWAGALTAVLALVLPGHPLSANASAWLPLHLALGIASYGLIAVAVLHAWLMSQAEGRIRGAAQSLTGLPLLTMERLIFRLVGVGFGLLSATLLAGFWFGSHLHGSGYTSAWGHKTVFSVLSWLVFAVLVVGRLRFGWRGRLAIRMLYVGSGLLLLAYAGSRFVLEIVLGRGT